MPLSTSTDPKDLRDPLGPDHLHRCACRLLDVRSMRAPHRARYSFISLCTRLAGADSAVQALLQKCCPTMSRLYSASYQKIEATVIGMIWNVRLPMAPQLEVELARHGDGDQAARCP